MVKRAVLVTIIVFQLVRLASPSLLVVDFSDNGTSLSFSSALNLVNWSLLAQLNPVKTIMNIATYMADSDSPVQQPRSDQHQRPIETTVFVSSVPETIKSNSPIWPGAGFAMLLIQFMTLLLILVRLDAIVLCRIRHLFARAREGICAFPLSSQNYVAQVNSR
jgi:hypothetical protein